MHGYFLSLQLYDTARLIANPYVYEEHRERMVQEKMEKMAETRIRTRKDVRVKVNKALAEKILKEAEKEKKRAERKAARKAKAAEGGKDEGDAMDVDEEAEKKEDEPTGKATLLNDPRFTALFENPEFQVDEDSREFALLNPSAAMQRQNQGRANGSSRRTKTAVEEEEEESDKASSDGLSESEDEKSDKDKSGSDSEDSDEAGGTCLRSLSENHIVCLLKFLLQNSGTTTFVLAWRRGTAGFGVVAMPAKTGARPTSALSPCARKRTPQVDALSTKTRPLASGDLRFRRRARARAACWTTRSGRSSMRKRAVLR